MLSGRDGLINFNSSLMLLATSSTLDFVCLTIPSPIALFLFALKTNTYSTETSFFINFEESQPSSKHVLITISLPL